MHCPTKQHECVATCSQPLLTSMPSMLLAICHAPQSSEDQTAVHNSDAHHCHYDTIVIVMIIVIVVVIVIIIVIIIVIVIVIIIVMMFLQSSTP
jgi:Flp pilus assembly protein TadB